MSPKKTLLELHIGQLVYVQKVHVRVFHRERSKCLTLANIYQPNSKFVVNAEKKGKDL